MRSLIQGAIADNEKLIAMDRLSLGLLRHTWSDGRDTAEESIARLEHGIAELEAANAFYREIIRSN